MKRIKESRKLRHMFWSYNDKRGIGKHPEERKISNRNAEANREIMLTGPRWWQGGI